MSAVMTTTRYLCSVDREIPLVAYSYVYTWLNSVCVCVPMPTHCTIMCFGFHARWIDGVKCGLFSNSAPLGADHITCGMSICSVREKIEVRVTVSVTVCIVLLCCVRWWWWWWNERRRWNPVPAHSLLFSKSTKGAARTDESLSTVLYAFSTYILRKGLEFNSGLWCAI